MQRRNDAKRATPDVSSMYVKCEDMRVIVIDRIENFGGEKLSLLETHVSTAARKEMYNFRPGKALCRRLVAAPAGQGDSNLQQLLCQARER